jgi:ABC-type antimicrobial peptide transport system permease subunit
MLFAVQTEVDPLSVISPLRSQLQKVDPLVPITNVKPYDQVIAESMVSLRVPSNMLTFLGLLTLLLAAAGVYSVLAYIVRQRTQEIGIRMALGAQRADVMRMVMGTALRMLAVGTAIGVPIALACGRVLSSLLFGVGYVRIDVIGFAILLMATTVLLAALIPARQAIRVDPIIAIKNQ